MWQYLADPIKSRIKSDRQSGLLLSNTLHAYCDAWCISIEPVSILSGVLWWNQNTTWLWFLHCLERGMYAGNIIQFTDTPEFQRLLTESCTNISSKLYWRIYEGPAMDRFWIWPERRFPVDECLRNGNGKDVLWDISLWEIGVVWA